MVRHHLCQQLFLLSYSPEGLLYHAERDLLAIAQLLFMFSVLSSVLFLYFYVLCAK